MSDEWSDEYETGGITMGPEDRLEREVAKSKALKVERLQLRDRISRLEEEVETLSRENTELAQKLAGVRSNFSNPEIAEKQDDSCSTNAVEGSCWLRGGIAVFLIAAVLLSVRWYFG